MTVYTDPTKATDAARLLPEHEYAGIKVKAGIERTPGGWIVVYRLVRDGANVAPGATYFRDPEDALRAIDILQVVDGDGQKFWHLLRALQRTAGELNPAPIRPLPLVTAPLPTGYTLNAGARLDLLAEIVESFDPDNGIRAALTDLVAAIVARRT